MRNIKEMRHQLTEYSKKNVAKIVFRIAVAGTLVGGGYETFERQGQDVQFAIEQVRNALYEIGKDCRIDLPDGKTVQNPKCKRILPPPGPWGS